MPARGAIYRHTPVVLTPQWPGNCARRSLANCLPACTQSRQRPGSSGLVNADTPIADQQRHLDLELPDKTSTLHHLPSSIAEAPKSGFSKTGSRSNKPADKNAIESRSSALVDHVWSL